MAVHLDNLGLSGVTGTRRFCPPAGTQVQVFNDDFRRPDEDTLGTQWGNMWCYADYPYDSTARPGPYSAAANPRTRNNRCQWFIRRDDDDRSIAFSIAWPWPLAWMTQGKFDQFVEIEVASQNSGTVGGVNIGLVFSGAAGSLEPDRYGQELEPGETFHGQYGTYFSGGTTAVYGFFGANPSATPDGLRGHSGINYLVLGSGVRPETSFPFVLRQETRWTGSTWVIRLFLNGEQTLEVTDNRLLQGQPCLIYTMGYGDMAGVDMDNLAEVSRFSGGLIGAPPSPPPPVVFPPVGTQLADFFDDFRRPYDLAQPPKNGDSLGPNWAVQWLMADYPVIRDRDEDDRPPINRTNPSILNGQCAFRAKLPNAPSTTACYPLQLAWIVHGFYDHYAQLRMREKPARGIWAAYVLAGYSPWVGTRHYDPGITTQSGFFGLTFGPTSDPDATSTMLGLWAMATTPESSIPNQSLQLLQTFRTLPNAPLGTLKRLEARWNGSTWILRVLFNQTEITVVNVAEVSFTGTVGQGLPAMACGIGDYGPDRDDDVPIVLVDDFRAGWLR